MEGTQQTLFYTVSIEVQVYVDSWVNSYSLSILQQPPPPVRLNRLLILLPAHKKLDSRKRVRKPFL